MKTNHATFCGLIHPLQRPTLLSVECVSLCIWISPIPTYHFVSHWILCVMRHQEPELHQVLKPGTVDFGWVWVPAMGVQVPSRVLLGSGASRWVSVPICGKWFHHWPSKSDSLGILSPFARSPGSYTILTLNKRKLWKTDRVDFRTRKWSWVKRAVA